MATRAASATAAAPGLSMELNSPWDLVYHDHTLYVATAGTHQLWSMTLGDGQVGPYAGTGGESITNGPLLSATLAQPSGITTDGEKLYFVDSETSSVRSADLDPNGRVATILGLGLFEFGDIDGSDHYVRLQHPPGYNLGRRRSLHRRHLQPQDKAHPSPHPQRLHLAGHRRGREPGRAGQAGRFLRTLRT